MYRVTVKTDGVEYLLHDPRDDRMEHQLIDPEFSEEIGKNGTFQFKILPNHPNKDKIIPMASEIMLWKDKELFFSCRMISRENDFYNNGTATCEGELAYLLDSIQRPYEFTGSVFELFKQLIESHNSQVEERKRFLIGNVTVAGSEIVRSNSEYSNTMQEMLTQLVGVSGGYLHIRYQNGKKYLDYVHDYGGINQQVIRFGTNLIDLTKSISPTSLITVLIPIGATLESEDTDKDPVVVDIKPVNGGKDYIVHQEAVNRYGQIWGSVKFEDITDPEALLLKGRAYLEECVAIPETIQLNAIDMSMIEVDSAELKVGYWTQVESKPHGISRQMMLSKKVINLSDPARNSIVLGQVLKSFTGDAAKQKLEVSARINSIASSTSKEINRKVENATQLITGGKGGYVVLDVEDETGTRTLPWRILIMNTPSKDTATNVIQINQNGIGFSTTGINGPYRNAWTIDGNLVADFITAGTMLSNRIRGGVLELGGSGLGRDGRIVVKDANDKEIGYWDKTGLHVLLGVIEGSEIRGSSIIGGMIDIGNGTFTVDKDGSVSIGSGEISIGNVVMTDNYTWLGDFGISANKAGAFYSRDSQQSVGIYSAESNLENGPAIFLKKGNYQTNVGFGGISTPDINLKSLSDEYGPKWAYVSTNIIELWNRIKSIESQL